MSVDLKELLAKSYHDQRYYIAKILGKEKSCIVFNAVKTYLQTHTAVFDVALLRQIRHLVDVKTAVDYHNRSEPVTQRINARSDSVAVWNEIYNQYILNPRTTGIAALATAGDATRAWTSIMAMLAEVESRY